MNEAYNHIRSSDFKAGRHYFQGALKVSPSVNLCVDPRELESMLMLLRKLASKHRGINGVQYFRNNRDEIIFHSEYSEDELLELTEEGHSDADVAALNRIDVYFTSPPALSDYHNTRNK